MKKLLSGIILGVSFLIPGFCSASMAMILGVYENLIELFSRFYKIEVIKRNLLFIVGLVIGFILSIIFFKNVYYLFPGFFLSIFIGLLTSNIKKIKKKKGNFFLYLFVILGVLMFNFIGNYRININGINNYLFNLIWCFLVSSVSSAALILPGLSGSMILFSFGMYDKILKALELVVDNFDLIRTLTDENFYFLFVFLLGFIFGLWGISKIIDKFLNFKKEVFIEICNAFLIGSIIILIFEFVKTVTCFTDFIAFLLIVILIIFFKKYKKIN